MNAAAFSAVVLAGGASIRMGRDKAFLPWGEGRVLLQRQIEVVQAAGVKEIFISGRPGTDYGFFPHPVLLDERPDHGPLEGMEAALREMKGSHLLVLAVDMPRMSAGFLERLMRMSGEETGAVPLVGGFYEPLAACYPRAVLPLLESRLRGGIYAARDLVECAVEKGLLSRYPAPGGEEEFFYNCNRPEDFQLWNSGRQAA